MSQITIRQAEVEDVENLYELFSPVDQMHREAHPEIFKQAEYPADIKDYYRACIQDQGSMIIIAMEEHKVIGGVICSLETAAEIPILVPRTVACIENITVSPSYRKKGVGRLLVEAVQDWANQWNATAIELTVWEFNQDAAMFYNELGFIPYRRRMVKMLDDKIS